MWATELKPGSPRRQPCVLPVHGPCGSFLPLLAWSRCHGRECVANVLEPADLSLYWGVDLPMPRVCPVYEQNMCGLGLVCELVSQSFISQTVVLFMCNLTVDKPSNEEDNLASLVQFARFNRTR